MTSSNRVERRRERRLRKAITAACEVNGTFYEARTYDINERGLTLFTTPDLPEESHYLIHCTMPGDIKATFEVGERQRRELRRGDLHFLRIGLEIQNESLDTVVFFRHLAELDFKEFQAQAGKAATEGDRPPRLQFELPVITKINDIVYRCRTLDMGAWGLSVAAPADFPKCLTYDLRAIDPDGPEVVFKAEERNRTVQSDSVRVGLHVFEGVKEFKALVKKYFPEK